MLPVILYNSDGSKMTSHTIVMRGPTFFFYSYENISVKILSGNGIFFSVNKSDDNGLIAKSDYSFSNNYGYTLYNNGTDTKISVTNSDGKTEIFEFIYKPDNVLTEYQEHYNDLLINNYLPTLEELEPALLPGTVKSDLIKRLLLDFKDIMRSKGTKESIEKFFYFIGFLTEQLQVLDEYRKNANNVESDITKQELLSWVVSKYITTNPNKTTDTKTGNYHVLFNNWNDGTTNGKQDVNSKNMPYRPFAQENLNKFFDSLKYGIALANKYFTLVEQEITFFGISMSVNIPMYQSITSSMNQIFEYDLNAFRRNIHIDLYYNYVTNEYVKTPCYIVKNCLQKDRKAYRSEIKFIAKDWQPNNELFIVEKEIPDGGIYDAEEIYKFRRVFANIIHLNIESPNTYVQITIENLHNQLTKLIIPKQYVENTLHIEFLTATNGEYKITIDIWDQYNSHEKYWYYYEIEDDSKQIDIDLFTSLNISETKNDITTDIDSGSLINNKLTESRNYILPIDEIPNDLRLYWAADRELSNVKWLTDTITTKTHQLHLLPEINKNYKVEKVTQTIPVTFTDQWLEFIVVPIYDIDNFNLSQLKLKIYDAENREYVTTDFNWELDPTFDKLFIRKMKIHSQEDESISYWLFISPIETGINMCKETFDIQLENGLSIYDIDGVIKKQIPVNFDFPLFPIDSNDENFVFSCKTDSYPIVKSIFPRLQKDGIDLLYLGDIIVARLNNDKVCCATNINWVLKDAFDNSVLYTTTDYALKYRLKENTIYTIECTFLVNNKQYKIEKTGLITTWKNK